MKDYGRYLAGILAKREFLLGSDLSTELQKKYGIKPDNARKIVERTAESKSIKASKITFGNGQFAYTHPEKHLSVEMIIRIAKEKRPALYRLMYMLTQAGGILPYHLAMKLCAAPLKLGSTKNDSIHKLLKELEEIDYAVSYKDLQGAKFIIFPSKLDQAEMLAKLEVQNMAVNASLIPDILRALQRYNIIDNKNVLYLNKATPTKSVTQNNFAWDAIAYTRTTGINPVRAVDATTKEKQTFVPLDIVTTREYTDEDLQGFYSRIQAVLNSVLTGKRKVMPVVVYSSASKMVISKIKNLGFLCFDLGSIYGSKIYPIIKQLQTIKLNRFYDDPDFDSLIEETLTLIHDAGQDDNLPNIKGDLFESLMFPIFKLIYSDSIINHGEKMKDPDDQKKEYEYDYVVVTPPRLNEVLVIELKGFSSSNYISLGDYKTHNTVKWFFGNTFPIAQKVLKKKYPELRITASYITTTSFKADALEFFEKIENGGLKPNGLDLWYDGNKLLQLLEQHKFDKAQRLIKRYYIKRAENDKKSSDTDDLPF